MSMHRPHTRMFCVTPRESRVKPVLSGPPWAHRWWRSFQGQAAGVPLAAGTSPPAPVTLRCVGEGWPAWPGWGALAGAQGSAGGAAVPAPISGCLTGHGCAGPGCFPPFCGCGVACLHRSTGSGWKQASSSPFAPVSLDPCVLDAAGPGRSASWPGGKGRLLMYRDTA